VTIPLEITDNSGCSNSLLLPGLVTVSSIPTAAFSMDPPDKVSLLKPVVYFTDLSIGATSWNWNFGLPGANSSQQNPQFTYSDSGEFVVRLIVSNSTGCTDTVYRNIVVTPSMLIYIPNSFTPNRDGKNDVFIPEGIGMKMLKNYRMMIFNRWGEQIFETTDVEIPWTGKKPGGTDLLQQDVYVYRIEVVDNDGNEHTFVGHVSMIM
jgi:gliding motility-associated-like protein